MMEIWVEDGITGVVVALFVGMLGFLQKAVMGKLNEIEVICIKLIDRWNRSDEARDRRHEDIIKEINDISDDLNFLKGKSDK